MLSFSSFVKSVTIYMLLPRFRNLINFVGVAWQPFFYKDCIMVCAWTIKWSVMDYKVDLEINL